MAQETIPGLTAPVHASMNQPILIWPGIPLKVGVGLMVASIFLTIAVGIPFPFMIWRILLVSAVVYLGVSLLVKGDHRFVEMLVWYLSYPKCLE